MTEIIDITKSPKPDKRYRITLDIDGRPKSWDFGSAVGSTYIDNKDKVKRKAWFARHTARDTEKKRIEDLIPSAALFSAYILWGESTDITDNITRLNALLMNK